MPVACQGALGGQLKSRPNVKHGLGQFEGITFTLIPNANWINRNITIEAAFFPINHYCLVRLNNK